jgi:(p)ppGpp synthase/HD superfamily hydrolase
MNKKNIKWSIDDLQDVWHLATRVHDGQKYGGRNDGEQIEYLNHIGGVVFEVLTALMIENDLDGHLALHCALLHDTIEDTTLTYENILNKYGLEVANGVLALTKDPTIEGKRAKMEDSLQRIKVQPKEVWAVKMADRIVNLYAAPYYWNDEKKREYVEEAQLIYNELHPASKYLADRLSRKIRDYELFIGTK